MGTLAGFVWTLPNSLLGVLLGSLTLRMPRIVHVAPHPARRVLVFDGPPRGYARLLPALGYTAQAFGHVLIGAGRIEARLLAHELEHVRQYRRWGPLYLPAYGLLFVGFGYRRHPFERAAERSAAGVVEEPTGPGPPRRLPAPR